MAIANNDFMEIKTVAAAAQASLDTIERTPDSLRQAAGPLAQSARQLNRNVADLVVAGQKRVSPVQSWRNRRARKAVRARLEAKYFKAVGIDEQSE
jgi:hypothetical protein